MKILKAYQKDQEFDVQVDDEDFEMLNQFKWFALISKRNNFGRVCRMENRKKIYMHRQIMGFPIKKCDHIDGNGFNNQRSNLREVTDSQSMLNRTKSRDRLSKRQSEVGLPPGIYNKGKGFTICITINYKKNRIKKHFATLEEAKIARNNLAQELGIQQFLRQ
jgi:hypothetical protein